MAAREGSKDGDRFGSGTPGDQGTQSVLGRQPDGGGAGLGEKVASGDGSPQDVAEAGGNPQHRNSPGPDSGEASELARESYDETERDDVPLRPASGDRNTASGPETRDLNR